MNRLRSSSHRVAIAPRTSPKLSRVRIVHRKIAHPADLSELDEHDDSHINVIVHLMIIVFGLIFFGIASLLLP